jgi:hypothetical protein
MRIPPGRPAVGAGASAGHERAARWSQDRDEGDPDDPDLEESPLVGAALVERFLGATVIDEIPVEPGDSPSRSAT